MENQKSSSTQVLEVAYFHVANSFDWSALGPYTGVTKDQLIDSQNEARSQALTNGALL
jgi:hypothetical protein